MSSFKILIVEDSDDFRMFLSLLLRKAGFETTQASTAESAMDVLLGGTSLPNSIVCDYQLPNMCGGDFYLLLRNSPKMKNIPLVLYSGLSEIGQIGRRLGIIGLQKGGIGSTVRLVEELRRCCKANTTQ